MSGGAKHAHAGRTLAAASRAGGIEKRKRGRPDDRQERGRRAKACRALAPAGRPFAFVPCRPAAAGTAVVIAWPVGGFGARHLLQPATDARGMMYWGREIMYLQADQADQEAHSDGHDVRRGPRHGWHGQSALRPRFQPAPSSFMPSHRSLRRRRECIEKGWAPAFSSQPSPVLPNSLPYHPSPSIPRRRHPPPSPPPNPRPLHTACSCPVPGYRRHLIPQLVVQLRPCCPVGVHRGSNLKRPAKEKGFGERNSKIASKLAAEKKLEE
ncbi:hypothetical protein DFH27DRAFT_352513 [Peziza echinospora]|nr:hypothetical protein DFH27DRAFT_352513 [Peziza echinospora]